MVILATPGRESNYMDPMSIYSLTTLLQGLATNAVMAMGILMGYAKSLMAILVVIDLVYTYIFLLDEGDPLKTFCVKTIRYCLLWWFIDQYIWLIWHLFMSFTTAGLMASGSNVSPAELENPTHYIEQSFKFVAPLTEYYTKASVNTTLDIVKFGSLMVQFGMIYAFFTIAMTILMVFLEFFLVAGLAILLLPWGVLKASSWITEGALRAIFASGIKVLVLSFIIGCIKPVVDNLAALPNLPAVKEGVNDPNNFQAFILAYVMIQAIAMIVEKAPELAGTFVSGHPSMSAISSANSILQMRQFSGSRAAGIGKNATEQANKVPPSPPKIS
jgi:type IV secretion system protein TrbL